MDPIIRKVNGDNHILVACITPGGADHMFGMSRSALGAGMVIMMRCHHLSLTMMYYVTTTQPRRWYITG